jgi:hypothetical protein
MKKFYQYFKIEVSQFVKGHNLGDSKQHHLVHTSEAVNKNKLEEADASRQL